MIVPYDTLTTPEIKLARLLVPRFQDFYIALYEYAFGMRETVRPDFQVTAAMREEFRTRLQAKGVVVDRADWDAGRAYIDRLLLNRIARLAYGDSTAKRRELPEDSQLLRAMELLRQGRTTADLLALGAAPVDAAARRPD